MCAGSGVNCSQKPSFLADRPAGSVDGRALCIASQARTNLLVKCEAWPFNTTVEGLITSVRPQTHVRACAAASPVCMVRFSAFHAPLHPTAPQEEGNIPYVVDNGVGAFETDPAKIADIMADWLAPENKTAFQHMAHRSAALGRPQAVYNIVHDLAELADTLGQQARRLVCCGGGSRAQQQQRLPVGQLVAA